MKPDSSGETLARGVVKLNLKEEKQQIVRYSRFDMIFLNFVIYGVSGKDRNIQPKTICKMEQKLDEKRNFNIQRSNR